MNQHQMKVKEYLMRAFQVDHRIHDQMEQIAALRELTVKANYTISDMPGNSTKNVHKNEDIIAEIMDMEQDLKKEIHELLTVKREIKELIRQVPDPEGKIVLEERYLQYQKWEMIAASLGYTSRQVYRIHDNSLLNIVLPETCQ